ncbi:MAG: hypothetical protein QOI31_3075 [Solirubrobacterales bacterium]|nr:hypothetical protein [Solirubrobacterales bacterium]
MTVRTMPTVVRPLPDLRPSAYFTDGSKLFRVVTGLGLTPGLSGAALEDCGTLSVDAYTADELWDMDLRLVRPPAEPA